MIGSTPLGVALGVIVFVGVEVGSLFATGSLVPGARVVEGILWLERLLKTAPFASVVISHDRYFLKNVATDMAELARLYPGGLFRVKGNYSAFLARKEEFILAQNRQQQSLSNQVRRELEWLRRGPKARTTKSKARIDAAGRLMEELAEVSARQQTGTAQKDTAVSDLKQGVENVKDKAQELRRRAR